MFLYVSTLLFWMGGSRFKRTTSVLPFLSEISCFEIALASMSDIYKFFKSITLFTNSLWKSWPLVIKLGACVQNFVIFEWLKFWFVIFELILMFEILVRDIWMKLCFLWKLWRKNYIDMWRQRWKNKIWSFLFNLNRYASENVITLFETLVFMICKIFTNTLF